MRVTITGTTSDCLPVLTLGAALGDADPASMTWARAVGALSIQVGELGHGVDSPVRLAVEFHVDGRIEPNQFVGVRTGRFSRARNHLVVQAAVAKLTEEDHRLVLLQLLDEAVLEAERFLRSKNAADGLPRIREVVARLTAP